MVRNHMEARTMWTASTVPQLTARTKFPDMSETILGDLVPVKSQKPITCELEMQCLH